MSHDENDMYATEMQEGKLHLGRFRVLRKHARGGLGQIEIALDNELQREIALKSIREEYSSSSLHQEKFNQEALVTGALEHPGVVPVYAFGRGEDGFPYYAMRFIRGEELLSKIKEFHQNVRSGTEPPMGPGQRFLIRKLIEVCHTIAYAHSRGVVHRDLKPANIMLGPYGETLVVDWGLAKPLGSAPESSLQSTRSESRSGTVPVDAPLSKSISSETQVGQTIGTIVYAPPEQLLGQVSEIDQRSDIYSLGVILFELLIGEPPIKSMEPGISLANFTTAVISGRVPTPRQCSSIVPKALDAICRKAMLPVRSDRYQNVDDFRLDLERWMDGLAVSVHPESFSEKASRWMREHIAIVRAAAASLLIIAIVSLVAMVSINNAKRLQESAKQDATKLLRIARETTDQLLQDTSDQLEDLPGATQIRLDVLGKAADSFEKIAAVKTNDPGLIRESASAFIGLASVQRMLDRRADAIKSLESAISTFKSIPKELNPAAIDGTEDTLSIAKAQVELSRVLSDDTNIAAAKKAINEAFQTIQSFTNAPSDAAKQGLIKGMALIHKGVIAMDEQDNLVAGESNQHAKEVFRDALRFVRQDASQSKWESPLRLQFARSLINEGVQLRNEARGSESNPLVRDAIQQTKWIIEREPKNREAIKIYILALNNQAQYASDQGDFESALASYKTALSFAEELQAKQSDVLEYRNLAVLANIGLGQVSRDSNAPEVASQYYETAYNLASDLMLSNRSSLRYRVSFAIAACQHAVNEPDSEAKKKILVQAKNAMDMDPAKRTELLKEAGNDELMKDIGEMEEDIVFHANFQKLRHDEGDGLQKRLDEFVSETDWFQFPSSRFNSACAISLACQTLKSGQLLGDSELNRLSSEAIKRLANAISSNKSFYEKAKLEPDLEFLRIAKAEEFSRLSPQP